MKSACSRRTYAGLGAVAYVALLVLAVGVNGFAADQGAGLEQGFRSPPASARPWVYYFIMDGNLTREGITADFEALRSAGIGGVIMMEVDVGIPRGPVKFMSPEWRVLFRHAVEEAKRLGLQITLNAGPGWTGSGGPWVKPEQSMQDLVASAVEATGPQHFDEALPRPERHPAFFGDGQLPPEQEKAKNEYYRDEAVLAFPTPDGKERITDIDEKALYVRAPYSSQAGVKARLPSLASYPQLAAAEVVAADRVVDLTGKLDARGRLIWDVPEGRWTIMRFGRTSTGACTRPAPQPGLGLECDKMDPAALDTHFDAFIRALARGVGTPTNRAGAGWTMLHIDSWEMGSQNWTAGFREEFRRRRGYDPLRYLPAMTGRVVDSLEVSERFLWDLRQTAQELVIQNHGEHLKALGREYGFGLSIEPYDMMPCADMSFGAVADVPMCEFWLYGFDATYSVFEAASIAHTCRRRIVAAESFTSTDAERWQAYPGSMKALGDWAFCSGVNRVVFHRYQHQPRLDARPGMTMGPYGVHWERTQTWWDMVGAYHEYLARCQFMLRQGLPVADVCFLAPEGAPQVFRPPTSARLGNPPDHPGYNYDGCAPGTLVRKMSVSTDHRLELPDGMSYRVLVLPAMPTMTPALLQKVEELVKAGATVIGPPPEKSPSLSGYPQCDREVRSTAGKVWGYGSLPPSSKGEKTTASTSIMQAGYPPLARGRVYWQHGMKPARAEEVSSPIQKGKWIWYNEGNPAVSAPVGTRYFRCSFTLDGTAGIESARVYMTADNSFQLWVNGRRAGRGDNFHVAEAFDVNPLLRPGANLLAVEAENGGEAPNPAGLAGELVVRFGDGRVLTVATDRTWQAAQGAQGRWMTDATTAGDWSEAMELGPVGMAPWGAVQLRAVEPEQYCDFGVVSSVLGMLGVPPDFESDGPVRYTHRRTEDTDIYFVANREDRRVEANCTFRVSGKAPELWDPVTGQMRGLKEFTMLDERTALPMRFEPVQSFFVIFRKSVGKAKAAGQGAIAQPLARSSSDVSFPLTPALSPREREAPRPPLSESSASVMAKKPELVLPLYEPQWEMNGPLSQSLSCSKGERVPKAGEEAVQGDKARIPTENSLPEGEDRGEGEPGVRMSQAVAPATSSRNFPVATKLAELAGPWSVSFDPKWGGPESVVFGALEDWRKRPEDGIRYYSGTAIYRKTFDRPQVPRRQRIWLDLGVVKNLARVRLNGHDLGVVWCAPWRVDITDAVKAKDNQLEIVVANLWPNRLIGDQTLPPEKRLTSTTWNPFKKDSPLLESGLLGPVTMFTERKESVMTPGKFRSAPRTVGPAGKMIMHDVANRLVTMSDRGGNLVLRLNYNDGCWLDRVKVSGREVSAPEGVCSAIRSRTSGLQRGLICQHRRSRLPGTR